MSRDPHYDDLDSLYRAIWGSSLHHGVWLEGNENIEEALKNLINLVTSQLPNEGTLADIGCGYGALAHHLVDKRNCRVLACTRSSKQAALIPTHPSIEILSGDWLEQELEAASLGAAVAIESLSHFPDFNEFFANTSSTLKPGGRLVIADWFSDDGRTPLLRHLASSGNLPPWRSLSSLFSSAKAHKLLPIRSLDLSRQVAPTWSHFFYKTLLLPFRKPSLLPRLLIESLRRPALVWSFPLLRLAYQNGDLQYNLVILEK